MKLKNRLFTHDFSDINMLVVLVLGLKIFRFGRGIYLNKLTPKQKRFADEYIIVKNATLAAKNAGYSEKTAYSIGNENLKKPEIIKYINDKLKAFNDKQIMKVEEAIKVCSSIARGEIQKGYSKRLNKLTGEVEKEIEYEYTPSIEERQKSLEHIFKCNGAFLDKVDMNVEMPTIISGDDKLSD